MLCGLFVSYDMFVHGQYYTFPTCCTGKPILHDTTVELTVDRVPKEEVSKSYTLPGDFQGDDSVFCTADDSENKPVIKVSI